MSDDKVFTFGKNWSDFLSVLSEDRIKEAEESLKKMIGLQDLAGLSFIDIGSGSGLFSLAAARLNASKIHSFDYDIQSVNCAKELKRRFFSDNDNWIIEQGSVLDPDYLNKLGKFDIVYSWGVLHHTGDMWKALENVSCLVKVNGILFISIYNDQGLMSKFWRIIKKTYNKIPDFLRPFYIFIVWSPFEAISMAGQIIRGKLPWQSWIDYKKNRGMSRLYDIIDWIGGYPFEVAKPEDIFRFYRSKGFILQELVTRQGIGCNEFVFRK
jgi:2-polyprenyl-6-hydroxyphenyl methylase/3-demethylubiquinone-9 3-methyltransferase